MADPTRSVIAVLWTCFGLAALGPLTSRADVFAAVNVAAPPPRFDFDVAIVNASLGTRVALPAVVNTNAFEIYPSISSDGRRLLFQRFGGSDGRRVLLVDTSTGQSADLFTPTEIALNPIFNSNITSDGTTVATGRRFRAIAFSSGTRFFPEVTRTDVRSFPTGPFPRSTLRSPLSFSATGNVTDVAVGGNANELYALRVAAGTGPGALLLIQLVPNSFSRAAFLSGPTADYGHPALASRNAFDFFNVFFEDRSSGDYDLVFRRADPLSFEGTPLPVPFLAGDTDDSQPGLTDDGRYLGFVRHGSDGHDRLFVRDQVTLTTLNPNGVDLGFVTTRGIGSVSLYLRTVITASRITTTGNVTATLTEASRIGILVQRITGVTKERGQKLYELEPVGRVPLGDYGAGNVFTHWDFEVDGEALPPGRYLVTLRAVDGDLIREFGEPQVLRIGESGHAHTQGKDDQ